MGGIIVEKEGKMKPLTLKPKSELLTMWYFVWAVCLIIALGITLFLFVMGKTVGTIFGISLGLVMFLFLMWVPRYYNSLQYTIENDSVKGKKGVFWKTETTVPFTKITNIDVTQGPLQRMYGIGTLNIRTAGTGGTDISDAELRIHGISDLEGVKKSITERIKEYMHSKIDQMEMKSSIDKDSKILVSILDELKGIRKTLEEKTT